MHIEINNGDGNMEVVINEVPATTVNNDTKVKTTVNTYCSPCGEPHTDPWPSEITDALGCGFSSHVYDCECGSPGIHKQRKPKRGEFGYVLSTEEEAELIRCVNNMEGDIVLADIKAIGGWATPCMDDDSGYSEEQKSVAMCLTFENGNLAIDSTERFDVTLEISEQQAIHLSKKIIELLDTYHSEKMLIKTEMTENG
jgi:hypothetical protein